MIPKRILHCILHHRQLHKHDNPFYLFYLTRQHQLRKEVLSPDSLPKTQFHGKFLEAWPWSPDPLISNCFRKSSEMNPNSFRVA